MILSSALFDHSVIQQLLDVDPVVADYRGFFSFLNWPLVEHWEQARSSRVRPAHLEATYLKAFFVRVCEGFLFTTQVRRLLLKHPLLVLELGFHPELDSSAAYGFDCDATLPCTGWLRTKLRYFDPCLLQDLLKATVRDLMHEIPGLGETVAFDVKHIYAWMQENNPRVSIKDKFDK